MVDFVKKKREAESKVSKSESSEDIDLNKEVFVSQIASDDNTICTRGTESSIITILRNSRREHFFDARIKLYREKLSLMEREGMMRLSRGLGARERLLGCCKVNRYQVYRILVTLFGAAFVLLAVFGILLLALLPKIAETQIRNSRMVIREIDVFQISRQNGETSFEVDSVLDVEKVSRYKAQFIHSLMQVSYGIGKEDARLLGELYVSHMFENQDGSLTARGRFTIKSRDSVNELITRMTSAMNRSHTDGGGSEEKVTFYGKGLMSLRIFGILVNNVNVSREMSYSLAGRVVGSPEGDSPGREGPERKVSPENGSFLHQSGFKMHGIWLNSSIPDGVRVNLEFELDVEKFLGNDLDRKGSRGSFLPKFHMENIGNLRFDVLYRGEHITEVTWYDVNLRPGSNVWSVSLSFPEKLNNGHKSLIMDMIQNTDISKESLTIRGEESSGGEEVFSDMFKDFEIKIPLSVVKSVVESELRGMIPEGSRTVMIDRLVQFVQVSHIQIIQDSEDLGIRARVKAGYVNPLGDHLPVSLNSMVLSSQLVDQNIYYGDITLRLDEVGLRDQVSAFRGLIESSRGSPEIISMIESGSGSSQLQRRAPRMQSKRESFIEGRSENWEKGDQHINKCKSSNAGEASGPLKLNACYNVQEFDMDLRINTDSVKPEVKSRWVESVFFNHRQLETRESSVDANITSVFGESEFNGISIKRNLLSGKSKIQLLGTEDGFLDDDYNFDNYYKEDEESEGTVETFSIKNLTNLIDANSVKILGEGFNDSWIAKVRVNHSDTLSRLGLDKLDVGPLGILIRFDDSRIGFIGTNSFRIEKNSTIELLGVIKPDYDSGTREINYSLTQFIRSMITGDRSDIQGKSFSLEFNTGEQGKENCMRYFNYPKYLSEEEFGTWLRDGELPPAGKGSKTPARKRKGWIGKLLNGQRIEIPVAVFDDFTELNIQKYLDRGMEISSSLIKESLCRVQSVFNNDIEFENSVDSDRKEIKKAIGDRLRERNIVLSNIMFQLFMANRENDLEIPLGGVFDLRVPNIISKELYMAVSSVKYRLSVYEKATERSILEFEHMQDFHDLSTEGGDPSLKREKTEHLDMKFNLDSPPLKLHDDHHQLTNTLYSLLNLPSIVSEKISDLVIKSTLDLGLVSSIGVLRLDNLVLTADVRIPECRRRLKALQANETESSINSIFKVESIQVQKIRLILPPRGIDIQINTVIQIPNYVDDVKFDLVMGQCVFELKNQDNHLLAIVKTSRQIIIGNNRVTESVCHGFVPAKSWLPMMNLVGNDEGNDEELLVRAISTPHGIPYWLVPVFKFLRLPASSTLSSLDSTEFGSVTFS